MQDPLLSEAQYGTVIDDVLCSLWFSTDTVRCVIQTQWNMQKLKHPFPVWRQFKVTHSFLGRFAPGGSLVSGHN